MSNFFQFSFIPVVVGFIIRLEGVDNGSKDKVNACQEGYRLPKILINNENINKPNNDLHRKMDNLARTGLMKGNKTT